MSIESQTHRPGYDLNRSIGNRKMWRAAHIAVVGTPYRLAVDGHTSPGIRSDTAWVQA